MPWVRLDDHFPHHRKVRGLSDPAFRLHIEALCWCASNLTDGFVPASDLLDVASARRPLKFVPELVVRRSWHLADELCDSKKCPAHPTRRPDEVGDGWLIHDYFEYQPTKAKVLKERADNAARQQKWRDKHSQTESGSEHNGIRNGVTDSVSADPPSRPVSKGAGLDAGHTGSQSVRAGAHTREAGRWLSNEYGLTDDEAFSVWSEVDRRATAPVKHPVAYLRSMAKNGTLADIVAAVIDAAERQSPPEPEPVLYAVPDEPEPLPEPEPERPVTAPVPRDQSQAFAHFRVCKTVRCTRCADISDRWPDLRRSGT